MGAEDGIKFLRKISKTPQHEEIADMLCFYEANGIRELT